MEIVFPRSDRTPSNLLCETLQKSNMLPRSAGRIGLLQCFGQDFVSERRFLLREYKSYPGQEKSRRFPMRTRRSKNIGFLQQHLLKYASAVCSLPNKRSTIKRCSVTMWIAFEKKLHLAARLDPGLNILEYRMQKLFFDLRKHIERIVRIFKGPEKFSNFIATGYDRKDFVEDVSGMGIALTIAWKFS